MFIVIGMKRKMASGKLLWFVRKLIKFYRCYSYFHTANPACEEVGCGEWTPPMIANPAYKGKWRPPQIENPNYMVINCYHSNIVFTFDIGRLES